MTNDKRKPVRTCIGCGKKKEKENLMRIAVGPDGQIRVDAKAVADGRGAYLCKDEECLKRAIKTKALHRTFRKDVPEEVYRSLEDAFGKTGE